MIFFISFRTAVRFLTRIPFPGSHELRPNEYVWSLAWYPIIGAVIGLTLGATATAFHLFLPALRSFRKSASMDWVGASTVLPPPYKCRCAGAVARGTRTITNFVQYCTRVPRRIVLFYSARVHEFSTCPRMPMGTNSGFRVQYESTVLVLVRVQD